MDIQHLVDRLEDLIDEGRHIWFSKYTLIDEEHALEIIDQMRISVPEQVEKASRLINQRDRLLAQANEEAGRVVQIARERSDEMVQRDAVLQTAQNRAKNIIDQAKREADGIRAEADMYVLEVLKSLEDQLMHNLTVARNGMAKVVEEREVHRLQIQAAYAQQEAAIVQEMRELVEAALVPGDPFQQDEADSD
jgi:hypothetical protein